MKNWLAAILLLSSFVLLTSLQAGQMHERPLLIKLGPAPNPDTANMVAGRFKAQLANIWVTRVLFYYGSLVDSQSSRYKKEPEYYNMYKTLEAAVKLNPYNMDAYYFAQAAFTWELGRVKEVNALLKYGMEYRVWDYWLPFYAGFNAAYFQHDYEEAARLMRVAAERSGNPLPTNLAARYFFQARETELGIIFLQAVLDQTKDERLRRVYFMRLTALEGVHKIEEALEGYHQKHGRYPESLEKLVTSGFLEKIPADPYGGRFYLDENGRVESTSQFASLKQNPGES